MKKISFYIRTRTFLDAKKKFCKKIFKGIEVHWQLICIDNFFFLNNDLIIIKLGMPIKMCVNL